MHHLQPNTYTVLYQLRIFTMAAIPEESAATTMEKPKSYSISECLQSSNLALSTVESPSYMLQAPAEPLKPQGRFRSYKQGDIVGASAAPLGADNKGRRLLEKMGYVSGTPLGRRKEDAIDYDPSHRVVTVPLNIKYRSNRAGLGSKNACRNQFQEQQKKQLQLDKSTKAHYPANNRKSVETPYQHPFCIHDLRDPDFPIIPVWIRNTLINSRRNTLLSPGFASSWNPFIKPTAMSPESFHQAHGHESRILTGNAFNVILNRSIQMVFNFEDTDSILREEGGVVIDEIADETLKTVLEAEYFKVMIKLENKAKAKQRLQNK
ncbi:squalene synthetase-like protein [Rhizina undulata]